MNGMLQMQVSERLSAIECIAHPFFDGMRTEDDENLIEGYNVLKQQAHATPNNYNQSTSNGRGEQSKSRVSVRSTMQSNDLQNG